MKTFSYKNALITFSLCLSSMQASACWSEPKQPSKAKKQTNIFTFQKDEAPAATPTSQDFYTARTIIAPAHVELLKQQFKNGNAANGSSKASHIEYYPTDEGKKSFTLANGQRLCAQESPQVACVIKVVKFALNSKQIVAVECCIHTTYNKLEAVKKDVS